MEKRRGEVTPLKKIMYTSTEESESSWWGAGQVAALQERKAEAVYERMCEYKRQARELEEEKNRILNAKIEIEIEKILQNTGDRKMEEVLEERILAAVRSDILECAEHMLVISQLRQRLNIKNREEERDKGAAVKAGRDGRCGPEEAGGTESEECRGAQENGNSGERNGERGAVDSSGRRDISGHNGQNEEIGGLTEKTRVSPEEIEKYLAKIEALEHRIEAALCWSAPNYQKLVKGLEVENAELAQANAEMRSRIEEQIKKSQGQKEEISKIEKQKEEIATRMEEAAKQAEVEKEHAAKEKHILQEAISELHAAMNRICSEMTDQTRELEKENRREECTEECQRRTKELEGKEIDRVEEISYLVRKYIDTSKENTALKLEIEAKAQELRHQSSTGGHEGAKNKDTYNPLEEECKRLELEVEKSKLDYLERKASSQYHKRRSIQFEEELKASRRTAAEFERTNQALQRKIEEIKKQRTGENSKKEVEVYEKMVRCAVCSTNIKNAVLKKCMHLMCRECIEERYRTRQRTCPLCGVVFLMSDVSHVYL